MSEPRLSFTLEELIQLVEGALNFELDDTDKHWLKTEFNQKVRKDLGLSR